MDGQLVCVKEYDWDPASSPTAEGITGPIVLLVRLMACCAAGLTPELRRALDKNAPDDLMARAVAASPALPLDVLGVSFPDVVIRDRIVGGESPKTRGMRQNPALDYEAAFARLGDLLALLRPYCRRGAAVHMTNDGHIAAFTAAAELAWQGDPDLSGGVVAHALGTDFGMGYLYGDGSIPEMPVELYDFLLDLGSFPSVNCPPTTSAAPATRTPACPERGATWGRPPPSGWPTRPTPPCWTASRRGRASPSPSRRTSARTAWPT